MAGEKTNAFETDVIDYFLRPGAAAPPRPTSIKVGLLTAITDAEAGTVTEAAYAGYAALDVGFGASADNGGAQRTSNAATLDFAAIPAGPDVPIIGVGIKDNLGSWRLVKAAAKTYSAGDVPRINTGALTHDES